MNNPQRPSGAEEDEGRGADLPPTPDEAGPHDVPDDKVIEKTLPSRPVPGLGSGDRPQ